MKRLLAFLGARRFLTLVGTAALAALVWFVGPLFGFAGRAPLSPESARWWVIGILFGTWTLVQVVAAVIARLRNRRLMEQLAAGPEPTPDPARVASQEEVETLRQRFDEALQALVHGVGVGPIGDRGAHDGSHRRVHPLGVTPGGQDCQGLAAFFDRGHANLPERRGPSLLRRSRRAGSLSPAMRVR